MTTTINRRTALLGTVTLPAALAPLGMGQAATTANATDELWRDLQQATRAVADARTALERHDATLPPEARLDQVRQAIIRGHTFTKPALEEYARQRGAEAMRLEEALGDAVEHECDVERHLVECKSSSPIDVARKLDVVRDHIHADESDWSTKILRRAQADLRRLAGLPTEDRGGEHG